MFNNIEAIDQMKGRGGMVKISSVEHNSIAFDHGIRDGDILLKINDGEINDAFDYRYYLTDETVTLTLERRLGDEKFRFDVLIKKDMYEDIGLCFETPLMDKKHSCRNKCIFCFIDQLPKGLRESLYFKDDDSRLSFLHGNYITLTNLKDSDIDRIIKMHLSPINVSVHTTNPELRCHMMNNRFAGDSLRFLDKLRDGGATLNAQIVLCKGVNDGNELVRTLTDLEKYYPALESISVVPAGLTKYRDGLYPLEPYTPEECAKIIGLVEGFAEKFYKKYGTRLVWCSDEMYLQAGKRLHGNDYYEDYIQYNNGVGMLTSLEYEFLSELEYPEDHVHDFKDKPRKISIATGKAAYPLIKKLSEAICRMYEGLQVNVYCIENNFFGKNITVVGLLTGKDLHEQLFGKELGEELVLSSNTVCADGSMFLCGMTPSELEDRLGVRIRFSNEGRGGAGLVNAILGEDEDGTPLFGSYGDQ